MVPDPTDAAALDLSDPLRHLRDRFEIPDPALSYLDGNSLGRPPRSARQAASRLLDEWSIRLVQGWEGWIDRPSAVGDLLAPVLGAAPGQVLIGESTTVALYKALVAAIRARPGRGVVVAVADDFPTDRYVVAGVADEVTRTVRWLDRLDRESAARALGDDVAVMVASAVHFESARIAPIAELTAAAHAVGALVVWDCSHAAGAVPIDLDRHDVDLAVGCTYKYLHGGPGSPAFVYVASRLQTELRQPVHGWFGQRDQFAMGPEYDPASGIASWQTGTPGLLALEVAAAGIGVVAEAGVDAIRAKSLALGRMIVDAHDNRLAGLGFELASPRSGAQRGGHVALRHPDASRVVRGARADGVIVDFRAPDIVRLGPGPLATSFTELAEGLDRLHDVVDTGAHRTLPEDPGRIP